MASRAPIPLRSRLLALALGVLFAVQTAAAKRVGCGARSLLSPGTCCCVAESTPASCCAAREAEPSPNGPSVRSPDSRCGCEMRAPEPSPALPRGTDSRRPSAELAETLDQWIAVGARASAATPCLPLLPQPDSPESPGSALSPSLERGPPVPDAVARLCGRGVNGLLAVLGVALR